MNATEFTALYTKKDLDETITPFQNETGFSLVRSYPKNTVYDKDGLRMFIKVALLDRGLFYGVDSTKPDDRGSNTSYIIVGGNEYGNKITGFVSDADNKEFSFNEEKKKIVHNRSKKEFTLNEFIEILVKNHLSDKLFWKRKLNSVASFVLKTLFWLTDRHYELVKVTIDKYHLSHFSKDDKHPVREEKSIEPFFRYFFISKNLIFTALLVVFVIAVLSATFPEQLPIKYLWNTLFGEFSLSNPLVVLFFFLGLFSLAKLSTWLDGKIKDFLTPKESFVRDSKEKNFVEKLHDYQHKNKFSLKI